MVKGLKERDMVKNFFGKYVGQAVMQDVLQKKSLELGGTLAHISVLFCDIRNFTSIAESLTPEKTVKMLNIYFSEIVQCIDSHKGYLDKYLGDGLLVVFGAPVKVKEHAQHACLAALDFVNSLERVNEKLRKEELPQIDIGVGIHSGDAVVGNIGAAQRMEYSVIGDTVNVASRVERLTRDFDKKILLTQETVDLLSGEFELDSIGCHLVKGKKSEICLYELKSRIKNLTKLSL